MKSEREISREIIIQKELAHPDYNKPTPVKELTQDRVYDLRYALTDDMQMLQDCLGLRQVDAPTLLHLLDTSVGDYTGVIGLDGTYHLSDTF